MAAQLVLQGDMPTIFQLDPNQVTIVGRSVTSDLVLDDKNKDTNGSSRQHAKLEYLPKLRKWELTDLKSTNGVLLQRSGGKFRKVLKATLQHGDDIIFGGASGLAEGASPVVVPSVHKYSFQSSMLPPPITAESQHAKQKIGAMLRQQETVKEVLRKANADLKSALDEITQKCASDLVRGLQGQAAALSMANILLQNENDSHLKTIKNQAMQITKHEGEIRNLTSMIQELKKRKKLDLHEVLAQIFQDDGEELRGLMQCVKTRVSIKYQAELDKANLGNQVSELKIQRLEEEIRRLETEQRCAKKQKCTGAAASPETSPEASPEASSDFQQGYPPDWHQSSTGKGTDGDSSD
jgi:hypothetical protein